MKRRRLLMMVTVGATIVALAVSESVVLTAPDTALPRAFDTSSASPTGTLACSVKPSPAAGEIEVFRMSSTANAHAGMPGGSAYGERVYCGGVQGLDTDCSGVYDTVLTLSASDNAHVATDGSYATQVCLSGGDDATVDVTYGPSGGEGYTCVATVSGSTNAHVADCDGVNDYPTKVWALVTSDNCPAWPNPSQSLPPWPVPEDDPDCDGFATTNENSIGTLPLVHCPVTGRHDGIDNDGDTLIDEVGEGANDEIDAWPPDGDDDQDADIGDVIILFFGKILNTPAYETRSDFDGDTDIDIGDLMIGFFNTIMLDCA